ncbi:hypothetical protein E2562_004763 [Oryza meyeriana var. granulata]|uniref:Uncharacterized protein n=1 Tax=Oryza meyeriana var. granulata TaxID=110450 RepID=A0A6G1DEB5_9ORYZ|nr:hypothetical protein E2562_004763 [Oryza meyeriana var. granulata]
MEWSGVAQVDRARVDCLVRTTVSALSASVSCRVDRTDGAEMLSIGSSVPPGDCRELVRSCAALLEKLGDLAGEMLSPLLTGCHLMKVMFVIRCLQIDV